MIERKTLDALIEKWEKDAGGREHQSKHGSPVSSMSEDAGEGMVAKRMREMIAELKEAMKIA